MEMLFDLLRIIMVNIVLSGDNAVVIALSSRALPEHLRMKAMIWGSAGAIILRLAMTLVAVQLLAMPYLQFIGGVLLLWIAAKLVIEEDGGEECDAKENFWSAVKTILIADIVMSLDNTLAIAAVAKGNIPMLALGFLISIPLIIFGSQILSHLMRKYPIIIYAGAMLIAWTAGELIVRDTQLGAPLTSVIPEWVFTFGFTVAIGAFGYWYNNMRPRSEHCKSTSDTEA